MKEKDYSKISKAIRNQFANPSVHRQFRVIFLAHCTRLRPQSHAKAPICPESKPRSDYRCRPLQLITP